LSFSSYLHHQFFNRLLLWAGRYKLPAKQQAINVVRKLKKASRPKISWQEISQKNEKKYNDIDDGDSRIF
jgi:hypothetical protein